MKKANKLRLTLDNDTINNPIDIEQIFRFDSVVIDKINIGDSENERRKYNFIATARKYKFAKKLLIEMANNGLYLVDHENGISTFEKFKTAESFKSNLKTDENIHIFKNLFYTIEYPTYTSNLPKLLIVFSSVADFPYNASIMRRNFFKNFPTIKKYIPQDTYILRISDIGAIVGSFYLNNNYSKDIEDNIQDLILYILSKYSINKNNVVLYGVSKGGTGALFHGVKGAYKLVAVDPIVSDQYHENVHNDSHFTKGTFPICKGKKFTQLFLSESVSNAAFIITSNNSPIYQDIIHLKNISKSDCLKIVSSLNPSIKSHPDVGPNTINILLTIINNLYYNLFDNNEIYEVDHFERLLK